ncbi:hypothetical protein BJ165DRAFT_1320201, partial [Panaeolus papilionaceus]
VNEHHKYRKAMGSDTCKNPYAPFSTQQEWELAKWAKLRGLGSTAFDKLMKIRGIKESLGLSFSNTTELNKIIDDLPARRPRFERHEVLVGSEVCEVYFRDAMECVKALYSNPEFAPYLVFKPEMHYTDTTMSTRIYHDMHTGKWWWSTQKQLDKDNEGGTIIPVIISTDKTQLTLFGNKSAYPVYLTIGNIPKEIRRKPSKRAYVLLGYLPTTRLESETNKAARRRLLANLYHACMGKILQPLEKPGRDGVMLTSGDGATHRGHPIFACFVGDYPEQVLVTCTYTGQCPECDTPNASFGDFIPSGTTEMRDLDKVLAALDSFDDDPGQFLQTCQTTGIKPVSQPFWLNLPYSHPYRSITPDVLHQLYQGIVKHVIKWVTDACGAAEIDARC